MDIEFHYYMTYLIAARAGYAPHEALIIAHSAQSVDDNNIPVSLTDQTGIVYENAISQTMDITRPHTDATIYPVFHFIPGDPQADSARRQDGAIHSMNTTPNSPLANEMIDSALASRDLYRIGVSAHGFVDTWAHQNFVGKRDTFNTFATGAFQQLIEEYFAVGHAHAKHNPDWPGLVWEDSRLHALVVDNRARFLDAAGHLYMKFAKQTRPGQTPEQTESERQSLLVDLDADIGARDDTNANVAERIARYVQRGATAQYGGQLIAPYVTGTWFSEAIVEGRDAVVESIKSHFSLGVLEDIVEIASNIYADGHRAKANWRDATPIVYQSTHWYRFQQGVKSHLDECASMLRRDGHL